MIGKVQELIAAPLAVIQAVGRTGELRAPVAQHFAVAIKDDDRLRAAAVNIDAILGIGDNAHTPAKGHTVRQLSPRRIERIGPVTAPDSHQRLRCLF